MLLNIFSLQKTLFEGEATSINCMTEGGEITILDKHRPLISHLKSGTITIIDSEKKEHFIPVSNGFLEVQANNRARFIVEE